MRILDRSVYVGPSLYARFPVIRLELDLGELEGWPTGRLGSAVHRCARARLCRGWPSTAAPTASRAVSSAACARAMAPGSGTCSSTWPSSCRTSPAKKSPSARRAAPAPRGLYRRVRVRAARRGHRRRRARAATAVLAAAAAAAPGDSVPEGWSWPEARDQFIRFAQRRALGPSTASLVRAAEAARHPLAAPERSVAGAARARQVPAAHPGDRHRPHTAHRGRARERQGGDQQDPRRPRAAGAAAGAGAERDAGGARRAPHRLPGGHQALQRQPRPRHLDPPDDAMRRSRRASRWRASTRAR